MCATETSGSHSLSTPSSIIIRASRGSGQAALTPDSVNQVKTQAAQAMGPGRPYLDCLDTWTHYRPVLLILTLISITTAAL